MPAYVYILRCADGSYYTRSTRTTLEARLAEHNAGAYNGYTAKRRPVELVWSEAFERLDDAIAAERRIKGWSRAKKDALIAADWNEVRQLAKRRSGTASSFETRSHERSSG
jgi:putative endonuclease